LSSTNAITIKGVTKTFGTKVAVSNLDLQIPTGKVTGFIGPNGAGKTTTIRMIMSIIFPDSGELSVLGKQSAVESKDRIGYLPEERGLYRKMKVGPFLTYIAKLKGVDGSAAEQKARAWLERVGLKETWKKKCEELSKGMQQKVQFISSVIHEPDLIILDEPFSGLDPVNRRLLRELIDEQHRAGRTIIFSTHAMFEAEALCDQIFMIHQGQKMLDGQLADIIAQFDPRALVVEASPEIETSSAIATLTRLSGFERVRPDRDRPTVLECTLAEGVTSQDAMRRVLDALPVRRLERKRAALEDIFIDVILSTGQNGSPGGMNRFDPEHREKLKLELATAGSEPNS